jgi:hypothetical protein
MTQQDKTTDVNNTATFHFYAANLGTWATTNPQRELPALIRMMEQDELPYVLMYLPVPHDADYQIKFFKPEVEGAVYLGTYGTCGRNRHRH